ncbi:MAG: carbohydrate ABC transporter permease [bacterium]
MKSRTFRKKIGQSIVFLICIAGAAMILTPVWWMLSTSLKSMKEIMKYPPTWYPEEMHFTNYIKAWVGANFTRYTLNTLFLAFFGVTSNVLSNSFIAYGFAKIKFPGRKIWFGIVLSLMMIPGFVTMIPQYILFTRLGWINTYLPLIVPGFFGSSFFIFLLRQFFMSIPSSLIEAARIDGASHFYIWRKIMIPLAKPAIATVAIFSFNGKWNDFVGPLLYLNSEKLYTIQIGLHHFKGQVHTQWNYLMAASLMALIPVVAIFFFFQRHFIEGMDVAGSTKG